MKKGVLIVYTGIGKDNATAPLGQVFRALGRGFKVCVIQFTEGSWKCEGLAAAEPFKGLLEIHMMGKGITGQSKNRDEDIKAAKDTWGFARQVIGSGEFAMVVLDELIYPMNYGMLDNDEVVECLTGRPESLHVVVIGREAPESLIDAADLVTEIKDVKHHHNAGIEAQKGVEF